jgi:hypothetical protein
VIEGSQPHGVKSTVRERKLRSGVNWQGVLKQKRRKTNGREVRDRFNFKMQ